MPSTGSLYSDEENNNEPVAVPRKRSALPKPSLSEPKSQQQVGSIGDIFSGLFALMCMVYSLYTTSLLIYFLSGNAFGILHDASDKDANLLSLFFTDSVLLCLFVLQHSFMASAFYKNLVSHVLPEYMHRSLYILMTGFILKVLTQSWINSLPDASSVVWDFSGYDSVVIVFQILHLFAWIYTFAVVFMLDFAEFMGLKQVYYKVNNFGCPLSGKTPELQRLFRHFRHATASGLMVVFWIVPCLTLDRLLLASVFTVFLFSTKIDEHDLCYVSKMHKLKKVALKCHSSP